MEDKKNILEAYVDACALVKETTEDLQKMRKRELVLGKVKGSNPDFPYQARSFKVSGVVETAIERGTALENEQELLRERMENAEKMKIKAEVIIAGAPMRIQRIIRYKIFENMTWEEVAVKMGGKATAESVRKEYQRFVNPKK